MCRASLTHEFHNILIILWPRFKLSIAHFCAWTCLCSCNKRWFLSFQEWCSHLISLFARHVRWYSRLNPVLALVLLMFSLRRDYFSFCCTKVLFAEYCLFYDSFVSNHYIFFLIKSLVLQSRFQEPMLSFIPPLVYRSAELCIPVPKESVCDTILY